MLAMHRFRSRPLRHRLAVLAAQAALLFVIWIPHWGVIVKKRIGIGADDANPIVNPTGKSYRPPGCEGPPDSYVTVDGVTFPIWHTAKTPDG